MTNNNNIVQLTTEGRKYWHPHLRPSGLVQWLEQNTTPHFGAIKGDNSELCFGYSHKKHAVLFNIIRESIGNVLYITTYSLTTDTGIPRRVPIGESSVRLREMEWDDFLRYFKRKMLGEGLYTLAGLAPRPRKMIYDMLNAIEDTHVNSYRPGGKYRLSKHNGRWRLSHDGKVCLDVNHLNMITQANLYRMAV